MRVSMHISEKMLAVADLCMRKKRTWIVPTSAVCSIRAPKFIVSAVCKEAKFDTGIQEASKLLLNPSSIMSGTESVKG